MALADSRRILILGPSGSGKSTLAAAIGERLGLPVIHLDAYYWNSGWVASTDDQFRARVAELAARPAWVMDGNYSSTLDLRLPRAQHAVYLTANRWRCLGNVVSRWRAYAGSDRPDMAPGCPEKVDAEFVVWILWRQPRRRSRTLSLLEASGVPITFIRARPDMPALLSEVGLA